MTSVSAHAIGRKPPHSQAGQPPLPRPRSFEAERVRRERQRFGVHASAAVHRHLQHLPLRIPVGTRAAPVRGSVVAREAAAAVERAVAAGWGPHDGGAVGLLDQLRRAGFLRLLRTPNRVTAGLALAMLARLSPLVERVAHGCYLIHASRPAALPPAVLQAIVNDAPGIASDGADSGQTPTEWAARIASAAADTGAPLSASSAGNRERAQGDLQEGPSSASVGEQLWLECDYLGAAAGSIFAPAEGDEARPTTPPARTKIERVASWTRSGWMKAIPLRPQLQRAAALALAHLPVDGMEGTAASVAAVLAGYEVKATWRSRASLARALEALARRGLLLVTGGWRVPEFTLAPALELFDVPEAPGARGPSEAMAAALERQGVDPEGLSHGEAVAVSRRLWSRGKDGRPHPRLLQALVREQDLAGLPVDLRAAGRLDLARAREGLARAMDHRRANELWSTDRSAR